MRKIKKNILSAILLISTSTVFAQVNTVPVSVDSMSLSGIINSVLTNYPALKKGEKLKVTCCGSNNNNVTNQLEN